MKNSLARIGLVLALLAITAFGAGQKYTCRVAGKTMDQCCCEMKAGKFYCPFTKKFYDKCCCDMK